MSVPLDLEHCQNLTDLAELNLDVLNKIGKTADKLHADLIETVPKVSSSIVDSETIVNNTTNRDRLYEKLKKYSKLCEDVCHNIGKTVKSEGDLKGLDLDFSKEEAKLNEMMRHLKSQL